jgi:hypothetical protein
MKNDVSPNWCGYAIYLTECNEAQQDEKRRTGDYLGDETIGVRVCPCFEHHAIRKQEGMEERLHAL